MIRVLAALVCVFALSGAANAREFLAFDGDTFMILKTGERIRLDNVDAPEIHPARCKYEDDLGQKARAVAQSQLDRGHVVIEPLKLDKYGRTVARVSVNGADLGSILVLNGLARPYNGGKRQPWC